MYLSRLNRTSKKMRLVNAPMRIQQNMKVFKLISFNNILVHFYNLLVSPFSLLPSIVNNGSLRFESPIMHVLTDGAANVSLKKLRTMPSSWRGYLLKNLHALSQCQL